MTEHEKLQLPDTLRVYEQAYVQVLLWGRCAVEEEGLSDPASWPEGMRTLAAGDGLLLRTEAFCDDWGRHARMAELLQRDGGRFERYESWPVHFEDAFGALLEEPRCRYQVCGYAPPPPEHLRAELSSIYEDGAIPLPADKERQDELVQACELTGVPIAVFRGLLAPERSGPEEYGYPFRVGGRDQPEGIRRVRLCVQREWGPRPDWVRRWAGGKQAQ